MNRDGEAYISGDRLEPTAGAKVSPLTAVLLHWEKMDCMLENKPQRTQQLSISQRKRSLKKDSRG